MPPARSRPSSRASTLGRRRGLAVRATVSWRTSRAASCSLAALDSVTCCERPLQACRQRSKSLPMKPSNSCLPEGIAGVGAEAVVARSSSRAGSQSWRRLTTGVFTSPRRGSRSQVVQGAPSTRSPRQRSQGRRSNDSLMRTRPELIALARPPQPLDYSFVANSAGGVRHCDPLLRRGVRGTRTRSPRSRDRIGPRVGRCADASFVRCNQAHGPLIREPSSGDRG